MIGLRNMNLLVTEATPSVVQQSRIRAYASNYMRQLPLCNTGIHRRLSAVCL